MTELERLDRECGQLDEALIHVRSELEFTQKQAAAMRDALEKLVNNRVTCADGLPATNAWLGSETRTLILSALQSDAGSDYIHRDKVKPLWECVTDYSEHAPSCDYAIYTHKPCSCGLYAALEKAKSLGL